MGQWTCGQCGKAGAHCAGRRARSTDGSGSPCRRRSSGPAAASRRARTGPPRRRTRQCCPAASSQRCLRASRRRLHAVFWTASICVQRGAARAPRVMARRGGLWTAASNSAQRACGGSAAKNQRRRVRARAFAVATTDLTGVRDALGTLPQPFRRPHGTPPLRYHFATTWWPHCPPPPTNTIQFSSSPQSFSRQKPVITDVLRPKALEKTVWN